MSTMQYLNITSETKYLNNTYTSMDNKTIWFVQIFLYVTILVTSLCGNIYLCVAILKHKRRKRPAELIVLNLAAADLGIAISCIPFDIIVLENPGLWVLGPIMCKLLMPIQTYFFSVMVWVLVIMSIHRQREVANPVRKRGDIVQTYILIACVWFGATFLVCPLIAVLQLTDGVCDEVWSAFSYRQAYTVFLFITQYVLPLILITWFYSCIWRKLHGDMSTLHRRLHNAQMRVQYHVRITRMLVIMVSVFAVCNLPHHVLWLWMDLGDGSAYKHFNQVLTFAYVITFISCVANPFIYGTRSGLYVNNFSNWLSSYKRTHCTFSISDTGRNVREMK